ncbi:MAG: hypothetical protein WCW17_02550 [Patescibacteria group bacterium]
MLVLYVRIGEYVAIGREEKRLVVLRSNCLSALMSLDGSEFEVDIDSHHVISVADGDVDIMLIETFKDSARLGLEAPRRIPIDRESVHKKKKLACAVAGKQ